MSVGSQPDTIVIPGTKAVLKQLLGSDYNNSAIEAPAEPKKPASLNLFLQWRKEFADAPVYKNLPPQEGLAADDELTQEERDKQAKVNTFVKENIDFELLDLEADIANKKKPITDPDAALDKEEEIFEGAEQILAERLGEPFSDKLLDAQTDGGLYKSDFTRDHEGTFKAMNENKALEDATSSVRCLLSRIV